MKTEIIPVVIGAFGVIKKGSEKYISEIPGKHQPPGNSKDNIAGNGPYFTAGSLYQVTTKTKQPSCALGSWFGPDPWGRNTVLRTELHNNNNNNNNNNIFNY